MNTDDALDIFSLVLAVVYLIICLVIISFVVRYRENEFNRLWRLRMILVILTLLESLVSCLTNMKWFPRQISSTRDKYTFCSLTTYFQQMIFETTFLTIITRMILSITNIDMLASSTPNEDIGGKIFFYLLFPVALGVVNLIISCVKYDVVFFTTYDEDELSCVESSYYQVVFAVYVIALMVMIFTSMKNIRTSGLNVHHQKKIKIIPFLFIPFLILCVLSLVQPYVGSTVQIVFKFIDYICTPIFMLVLIGVLVIKPIWEANQYPLERGNITMRHGKMKKFILSDDGNGDSVRRDDDEPAYESVYEL